MIIRTVTSKGMKKLFALTFVFFAIARIHAQSIDLLSDMDETCTGEVVSFSVRIFDENGDPAPTACIEDSEFIWSGSPLSISPDESSATYSWNSGGSPSVNVNVSVRGIPGNCDLFFDASANKTVTIGEAGTGEINPTQNQYILCDGNARLEASPSGDALAGWIGWFDSSNVLISSDYNANVTAPGIYEARASVGTCGMLATSEVTVSLPSAVDPGVIVGNRTVYQNTPVEGEIRLINTSSPIEKWQIKEGSSDWIDYETTSSLVIFYAQNFTEETKFRVVFLRDCPASQDPSYSDEVTIGVTPYIPDFNKITTTNYTLSETEIAKSAIYYDEAGKAVQSQSKDFAFPNTIHVNEPLYDSYARKVGQTLTAPIDQSDLQYKLRFATVTGSPLSETSWSGSSPQALDNEEQGTLGYYYANSTAPKTKYPYAVSSFYEDGSGEQKTATQPGDEFFLKSTNNAVSRSLPVFAGEVPHYGALREALLPGAGNSFDRVVKQVLIDGNGNQVVSYTDDGGNTIATCIAGLWPNDPAPAPTYSQMLEPGKSIEFHNSTTWVSSGGRRYYDMVNEIYVPEENPGNGIYAGLSPGIFRYTNTSETDEEVLATAYYYHFSYNFYDNKGRLIASMTPKGVQGIIDNGGVAIADGAMVDIAKADLSESYYTTLYSYDFQGRLLSMNEPDAGLTSYRYRKDGQIRYSQNADQADQGANFYSYTNYDALGRPIASGECAGCSFTFTAAPLVDNITDPNVQDVIQTSYDQPDESFSAEFPGYVQEFVQGAVSTTESDAVKSWYSYDDQGRVVWFLQKMKDMIGPGVSKYFLIEYTYDFLGNVLEVAFQPQTIENEVNEAFIHAYTYDGNQRLKTVHTTIDRMEWYLHATYEYEKHGPLKRLVLAEDLQGIDYTYTPQGWLKSVNHPVRALDPGKDGAGMGEAVPNEDAFGMTLEYFEGDQLEVGSLDLDETAFPAQYNGNIRATVFGDVDEASSKVISKVAGTYTSSESLSTNLEVEAQEVILNPGFKSNGKSISLTSSIDHNSSKTKIEYADPEIYAYTYDEQYQLTQAKYTNNSNVDPAVVGEYDVNIAGYDENGNIDGIERYQEDTASPRDAFVFHYDDEIDPTIEGTPLDDADNVATNRLLKVDGYIDEIKYNSIGQVVEIDYHATVDNPRIKIQYDVTGKVVAVLNADAADAPIMEITYDDRGFRLMKRVGAIEYWYIRDASGQVMGIYCKGTQAGDPVAQLELPIYGVGKLGMSFKNADHYKHIYELTDHLGNVRALVSKLGLMATATMETDDKDPGIDEYEEQYFDNINRSPNFYKSGAKSALTNVAQPVGPTTTLRVNGGDEINLEVWAYYNTVAAFSNLPVTDLIEDAVTDLANGTAIGVESANLTSNFANFLGGLLGATQANDGKPEAYLQFVLLDEAFQLVDLGDQDTYVAVNGNQEADENNFEALRLSFTVPEEVSSGYLYAFVLNESDVNVFWDDFSFQVLGPRIIRKTDYYPFGAVAKVWNNPDQTQQEQYRHDYQGQYAEKDEETGWNAFEARMYDPLIGRWLAIDPARQFSSPYNGMGNNPTNGVDPDGAWVKGAGFWRNLFRSDQRIYAERYAEAWTGDLTEYAAYKYDGGWGIIGEDTEGIYDNFRVSTYTTFTEIDSDGNITNVSGAFVTAQLPNGAVSSVFNDLPSVIVTSTVPVSRLLVFGKNLLTGGRSATQGTYSVYQGIDAANKVRYVGITSRAPKLRWAEHALDVGSGRELLNFRVVKGATNLTKIEARIWEQTLINQYKLHKHGGLLLNKINSISPSKWSFFGIN